MMQKEKKKKLNFVIKIKLVPNWQQRSDSMKFLFYSFEFECTYRCWEKLGFEDR